MNTSQAKKILKAYIVSISSLKHQKQSPIGVLHSNSFEMILNSAWMFSYKFAAKLQSTYLEEHLGGLILNLAELIIYQ